MVRAILSATGNGTRCLPGKQQLKQGVVDLCLRMPVCAQVSMKESRGGVRHSFGVGQGMPQKGTASMEPAVPGGAS